MKKRFLAKVFIGVLIAGICTNFAASFAHAKDKRSKVIDFEDEVVEGMNRKPLDSLSQISERDKKRKKPHLYRKRVGFRTETADTLKTLNLAQ